MIPYDHCTIYSSYIFFFKSCVGFGCADIVYVGLVTVQCWTVTCLLCLPLSHPLPSGWRIRCTHVELTVDTL